MQTPVLAAVLLAAGLLSACGFTPPAPPKPSDSNRIAINQSDPRLYGQDTAIAAPAPDVVATSITATGPVPPPTPEAASATAAQPAPETVAMAPIPVPQAPEPLQKPTSNAPALIDPASMNLHQAA